MKLLSSFSVTSTIHVATTMATCSAHPTIVCIHTLPHRAACVHPL